MHIALLTRDEALCEVWLSWEAPDGDRVVLFRQPESFIASANLSDFGHIVMSDRFFDYAAFCEYVEQVKEAAPGAELTVMLSDRHDTAENGRWIKYCLMGGIPYIPPHRTIEAITGMLMQRIYGEAGTAVAGGTPCITFVGSTPNIGTTFVSFGTAVRLAASTRRSVGYLCLNLKSSKLHRYLGLEKPEASLDHLRAEIRSQSLRPDRLHLYCEPVKGRPNLRILFGNQLREQAEFFTAEDIEHLLRTARRTFDVCIVEVNAYWDNAATICALLQADTRILVTTPDLAHFQEDTDRWLRGLCPVIGLAAESFDLILTQAEGSGGSGGIRHQDVRKETGLSLIGKVGKYSDLTETVNQGKLLELLTGKHPLNRDLDDIVRLLSAVCGIEPAAPDKAPAVKRIFGRLTGALGIPAAKPRKARGSG
ncbi:MAG: hypothetical protein K0Q94_4656 [Paenibacillus sp.]|nr:hypothetical protein [Paenibacillus sp.]